MIKIVVLFLIFTVVDQLGKLLQFELLRLNILVDMPIGRLSAGVN